MNNRESFKKRLTTLEKLDVLRLISANLVIICHLIDQFIARKNGYQDPYGIGHLNCWLGIMSVFCFFVLSGYVITFSVVNNYHKKGFFDLKDYVSRRFFRIYPTALCSLVYMLCIVVLMKSLNLGGLEPEGFKLTGDISGVPNYLSTLSFLYSVFLPPSGYFGGFFNVAMWTLSYEFGFYLCFGIMIYLRMHYGAIRCVIISCFASCVLFVWYTINFNLVNAEKEPLLSLFLNFLKNFPAWNFLLFFAVWFLGVLLFLLSESDRLKKRFFIYLSCFAGVLMFSAHRIFGVPFNYNVYSGMSVLSDPEWSPIMTFAYGIWIMLFIALIINLKIKSDLLKWVSFLGRKYSFTLYVTHYGMINLAFGLLWHSLNKFSYKENLLLFAGLVILTNVIAFYLSTWFEHRDFWVNIFSRKSKKLEVAD